MTVRLGGRVTTVHPAWTERFQRLRREDLHDGLPALFRLRDELLNLLQERPVCVVIERIAHSERALVVRGVDLFDLAVFLRLPAMPLVELRGAVDVEQVVLRDGFVELLIHALVTRPDRVVTSFAKSELLGKPLIVPKERSSGKPVFALVRKDISRLLGRDAKTLRNIERNLQRQGDAGGSLRSAPDQGDPTPVASAHGKLPVAVPPGRKRASRSVEGDESKSVGAERGTGEAATEGILHKGDPSGASSRVPDSGDGLGMDSGSSVGMPERKKRSKQGHARETGGVQRLWTQPELNLIPGTTASAGESLGAEESS